MGLVAKNSGDGNFKRVPAGNHIARCFSVIDLGTQRTTGQYGEKDQHRIRIAWEIFGEDENGEPLTTEVDGKQMPLTINKSYTLSLHEKAGLRKDLASWRGRDFTDEELNGFDISKLLGVYCMVNVTLSESNGKTYSNVASVTPMHKSMVKPDAVHANQILDLDNPDMSVFSQLHEKLQDYIKQSPEWKKSQGEVHTPAPRPADDMEDDIPF